MPLLCYLFYTADTSILDYSGKTALDYATEKGKHYCALLLTKAEVLGTTDRSGLEIFALSTISV